MPCKGVAADYLCLGWQRRAALIRERDGGRCRGCNRTQDEVRLEVHHRTYGAPGPCGACILTGVHDNDLTLFCVECHDALTDIRRRTRYAVRIHEAPLIAAPIIAPLAERVKTPLSIALVHDPPPIQTPAKSAAVISVAPVSAPSPAVRPTYRSVFDRLKD